MYRDTVTQTNNMCLQMLTNKIWQCLLKYNDHKDILVVWTPRSVDSITKISMKLSKYVSLLVLFPLDKPARPHYRRRDLRTSSYGYTSKLLSDDFVRNALNVRLHVILKSYRLFMIFSNKKNATSLHCLFVPRPVEDRSRLT